MVMNGPLHKVVRIPEILVGTQGGRQKEGKFGLHIRLQTPTHKKVN